MMSTDATLEDVPAELWVADGRMSMEADGDSRVAFQTPEHQPLSIREPEFTLQLLGDNFEATISLTPEQADVLQRVLGAVRGNDDRWCSPAGAPRAGADRDERDDVASSNDGAPEPIEVDASVQLDYADDPTRPLSIDVAIPADVINEDDLDEILKNVSIDARLVDE